MKLISRVKIERFRSLKLITLDEFDDFTVFAGLNNSGKSNVLRALNAFFNEETEQDRQVVVASDYFRGGGKVKRKRQIRITVYFNLPQQFKFNKKIAEAEQLLGGQEFSITKEWVRDEVSPRIYLNEAATPLNSIDRQKIIQFLSLISFRYIPNRVVPTDIIKQEHQALRDALIRRLGAKKAEGEEAFRNFVNSSTKLTTSLADDFRTILPAIKEVRLSTPTSWEEIIFAFGYKLKESSVEFDDVSQGSGIQSLLMFETLHLIDREYGQRFGWRQASIWAVEEPESSLHSSLEAHTALLLSRMAHDPKNRLQVLATTHSDMMIQYSDGGYLVKKTEEGSKLRPLTRAELLDKSAKEGISRWIHPVLYSPITPLFLVDGKIDHLFITRAMETLGLKLNGEVIFLEKLSVSDGATGGSDNILAYIKNNKKIIRLRPIYAPVIVVLDWEDSGKKGTFEALFSETEPFKVVVWPKERSNPKLNQKFRGIERFYSDRLISIAERKVNIYRDKKGVATIEKEDLEKAKEIMFKHIQKSGLRPDDLVYAEYFIKKLIELGDECHMTRVNT